MYIDEIRTNINGRELLLRSAHEEDAEMLIEFLKITSGETRFLVKEPEEITLTLKDEINFINYRNDSTCDLLLLGFLDGEYVGNCALTEISPADISTGPALELHYIKNIPE